MILCAPRPTSQGSVACAASTALAVAMLGFVILIALAMRSYPGGTAWDATTRGHDFWLNYLCDLERRTALNGEPNVVGSELARGGMLMLAIASGPFWWLLPRLFPARRHLGLSITALGWLSLTGIALVAMLPNDRFAAWHPFLMALSGVPGLAAAACGVVGLAKRERGAAALGAVALVVAFADFVLYGQHLADTGPMAVAVLERVSLVLILVWVGFVSWRVQAR